MCLLFFNEESIHEVSRGYIGAHKHIHTYIQSETNMLPSFSIRGHNENILLMPFKMKLDSPI